MIIDHTHPLYKSRLKDAGNNKYNGAYYYSKEIVKNIIPNVKTDRNWITVNLPNIDESIDLTYNEEDDAYVEEINALKIGEAAMILGAGTFNNGKSKILWKTNLSSIIGRRKKCRKV